MATGLGLVVTSFLAAQLGLPTEKNSNSAICAAYWTSITKPVSFLQSLGEQPGGFSAGLVR